MRILTPPARLNYGRDFASVAIANGQFLPTTGPENLFDGDFTTRWLVNQPEGFVEVHFVHNGNRFGYVVDEFTLTNPSAWNDRDPREVVLSGTLDGVNWQVIQTWTQINWQGRTRHTMSFPFTNNVAFTGYRWDIVPQAESPQGWFVELNQIELFARSGTQQPEIRPPVASFAMPDVAETRQPVTLDARASLSPDGYPLMYFWDFGNGQTQRSISPVITHRFF
ncbi:MAG: PKD domain-containing protein [Verrucomicrobia bacterium]|nr:PKD domain-containing protein [Verrucomicrobiota bacterium]